LEVAVDPAGPNYAGGLDVLAGGLLRYAAGLSRAWLYSRDRSTSGSFSMNSQNKPGDYRLTRKP